MRSLIVSFCPVYCIILPSVWDKMIQLTTHFEWSVSSTNVTLCLYFSLSSCSQYLTVHYTFKSNKIYQVIRAGKNISKKWIILPRSPLEYRRERSDMIQVYKIVHGIDTASNLGLLLQKEQSVK